MNEIALMKLYTDITGASEAMARSVLMHVIDESQRPDETQNANLAGKWGLKEPFAVRFAAKHCVETGLTLAPAY